MIHFAYSTSHLAIGLIAVTLATNNLFAQATPQTTLKSAVHGKFEMGVGISDRVPDHPEDWELLLSQFAMITPENCMKPAALAPEEGKYRWDTCDKLVEFAVDKKLGVVGHCLVWAKDDRTPPWFFEAGAQKASREQLIERMNSYITEVAGRYKGKIAMWDVVNEALDDGKDDLRPSGWLSIAGPEFIGEAFRTAHKVDPNAILIYNDYNNELPGKREKMIRLIKTLQLQNVPVHAIGLQGHYTLDEIPLQEIEDTIVEVEKLGLKIVVSELDIDVIPRAKWWAENGKYRDELSKVDPYREGCPPEILERQAKQYGDLFAIFKKHSKTVLRISFWNLHDGQSWLNYFPWNRVNHPLLFDRERNRKPAFEAVIKALQN